ncbi:MULTISPECIES: DNA cytosine methyltransferase [unclassified Streptomyces]|uniref:DNA cytosine methyltransferase n=1 Tax=unclassified Streptomyces TaxID=2593676 RepID=UPI002E0EB7FB|nr:MULTISPECIES: DNA (cytosine-5-)-methyltransferase [unclassified Streptomyces]WSJ38589.1 DNA (cytosine-5-)-methyltransferase [Streptomyces sp. NBC_01321]WSP64878.1 DNA (cytosine-5-)-methyltransferase [Streptomyces sp. NBC_01240]
MSGFRFVDVCAGAGGLALGLEQAGFEPVLLLDNKPVACETLRVNRPTWKVLQMDLLDFIPDEYPETYDVDLLSAGLPRVKSSATAARAETEEEQRLLEAAVLLAHSVQPRAMLIENVPGLVDAAVFETLREFIRKELEHLGYRMRWFVLNAADFGVPQDRKQGVLVALKERYFDSFRPPGPTVTEYVSVGRALHRSMAARGWRDADVWAARATGVAPTLVGGSDNRGGADLGPTGTKKAWARMGVNGGALADEVPGPELDGCRDMIKLTDAQAALLQGFPDAWRFAGRKTARYRQIGHASPPPVGKVLGSAIAEALRA